MASIITTPSRLWAEAAHVSPLGDRATHDDTCVMCGAAIAPGEPRVRADAALLNESFNNKIDCKHPGESVCGYCMALWDKRWLQSCSKSYAVQGKGVFHLRTNQDIAAFVLTPPPAAYVAIFNTRQQAHMIWRTPVSLPSPWLKVRVDDELLTIDRERVMSAVKAWQYARVILKEVGFPKSSPAILSYDLTSLHVGKPTQRYWRAIEEHSDAGRAAMAVLEGLTVGDWWAVSALREIDMDDPHTWPAPRLIESEEIGEDAEQEPAHA